MLKRYFSLSLLIIFILIFSGCVKSVDDNEIRFSKAEAVWPVGLQLEKNITIGFKTDFNNPDSENTFLRITGHSLYRIYLNNEFVGHGPARAGHGYYRLDEWDLKKYLKTDSNTITIEVAGYNVNSFYLLDQPSFVQAEIVSDGKILAATSTKNSDFSAYRIQERVQKVPRYSFQRPFIEFYKLSTDSNKWKDPSPLARGDTGGYVDIEPLILENVGPKNLIPRRIPYPDFNIVRPTEVVASGTVKTGLKRDYYWRDRAVVNIGPKLGGFTEDELEYNPAIELQETENESYKLRVTGYEGENIELCDKQFVIIDLGTNLTGFIGLEVEVHESTRLFVTFDEILQDGDVNFKRLGTIAALTYDFEPTTQNAQPTTHSPQPTTINLESFEPYTFRYMKVIVTEGDISINDVYLREYANPDIKRASFESSDDRLNRIFDAGVETFRQNAVDIFMDCPHRERAGWLCDSYFTARVAQDLSGNSLVERNFLENFLLPDSFAHLPKGMLPMCYPADHNDSVFIPNWAMWFVVELEEYLDRSQDRELVNKLESKVMALLDYFEPFKNEDGLLENLESWIFVEWSAANRFVQDVNYPTNMLFAKTLEVAGNLYGKNELIIEAKNIRQTIRDQSFNGQFFIDNAQRVTGDELRVTSNKSEVCQYFAFFFGIATPETHTELWNTLSSEFGPNRQAKGFYPDVHPANAFVGNYLRLELLSKYGLQQQILEESIDYFDYMAVKTGTLWENISTSASCNHGFASHIVHALYRDVLGIAEIDYLNNIVKFRVPELDLDYCKGQIPIGDELIKFEWKKTNGKVNYKYDVPDGYALEIME